MDEALEGVRVLSVSEHRDELHVDVYGGPSHACASVRFTLPDGRARRRARAQLREWARQQSPLTLLRDGTSVTLRGSLPGSRRAEPA